MQKLVLFRNFIYYNLQKKFTKVCKRAHVWSRSVCPERKRKRMRNFSLMCTAIPYEQSIEKAGSRFYGTSPSCFVSRSLSLSVNEPWVQFIGRCTVFYLSSIAMGKGRSPIRTRSTVTCSAWRSLAVETLNGWTFILSLCRTCRSAGSFSWNTHEYYSYKTNGKLNVVKKFHTVAHDAASPMALLDCLQIIFLQKPNFAYL